MKLELLKQIDQTLSKCGGRPPLPGGVSAVPIPRGFVLPMVIDPGASYTFIKEITGDAPWVLRSIASDQASASLTGIRIQIQLPNGRFLFGQNGIDAGQFCWIGSWQWLQDPDLRCEPGSKITVTLSDALGTLGSSTPVNLLFEGADLYFMKGGTSKPDQSSLASALPRYFGIVDENILAPAWMSGQAIQTPPGFKDEYFVYSTFDPNQPGSTALDPRATWTLTAGSITQTPKPMPFEIVIDSGYEFFCRRILCDLETTSTAAAIVLGKLRTGGGFSLLDNYVDLVRYLNGAEFAGYWRIKGTESIFADLQLADVSGTGSVSFQIFLEGFRRSKR